MERPEVDTSKVHEIGSRISMPTLIWLRNSVDYALSTAHELREFLSVAVGRARDPQIDRPLLAEIIEELTADEIVWLCDHFKSSPQHDKRRFSRSERYKQIPKPRRK